MAEKKITYLKDYKKPSYLVEKINLTFDIFDEFVLVENKAIFYKNPEVQEAWDLILDWDELELIDIFLEDNTDFMQNSSYGLELDWYFSDDTTFSVGTKQRINSSIKQENSLDSLTGNIQYIKFQHNL